MRVLHRSTWACAVLGAMAAAFVASHPVRADEELLSRAGEANQPVVIRDHAGWDRNCDAIAPPAVALDVPPRHGIVCVRIEPIKIQYMYTGTESQCVGRVVRGIRLIYLPRIGYAGPDALRYSVQYPSLRRTVAVSVAVTAHRAAVPGATPTEFTAPVPQARQEPGPIPACNDSIS